MKQTNLIKIGEFQINDYGFLLISETDGLPFLAVDEKGIAFDAGPFTGAFCSLEDVAKFFIIKDESGDTFSLQLMFAEGDVYPMGKAKFNKRYNDALCWVIAANKQIAEKKGDKPEYSTSFAKEVVSKIIECLGDEGELLTVTLIEKIVDSPDFPIEEIVPSKDRENLIKTAKGRFSIFVPDNSALPIKTIAGVIRLVNAQVKDEKDFRNRPRHQVISERNKNQVYTS